MVSLGLLGRRFPEKTKKNVSNTQPSLPLQMSSSKTSQKDMTHASVKEADFFQEDKSKGLP